jgi:uncharacterized protein (TIRG00374 family)
MADAQAIASEHPRTPLPPGAPADSGGRGWRRPLAIAIGVAVSVGFSWLALSKISLSQVGESLADAHYLWVIPAIILLLPIALLRAWRWKLLFVNPDAVPMTDSFAATNVGLMANNLLPQRVGEVPRVFALRRTTGLSAFEIAATVIVERVLDVFVLALLGAALWPLFPDETWVTALGLVCVGLIAATAVLIASLAFFRERLGNLLLKGLRKLPFVNDDRAREIHLALIAGGAILLRPRQLSEVLAITALIWAIGALSIWVLFPAFDLDLGASAPWLILLANTFAIMLPSGPATLGVYEASVQVALIALGISASTALSYAVVLHAVNFFPVIAVGAACSWWIARQPQQPRAQEASAS